MSLALILSYALVHGHEDPQQNWYFAIIMDGFESNVKIARANQLIFVQLLGLWEIEISTGWLKKTGISNQKPAWKAWCCESCLTSLPLPTGPYLTLYSNIIVSTSPIDMNENMKRNHKDIEWKQLFFEIPVFFYSPCS